MKINVERIEENKVELEVELGEEKIAEGLDRAYKKLVKDVEIPGFRKGKAPKQVFINYVGKQALYNEAAEAIVPEAYFEAVEKEGLEPVEQPELELVQLEEEKPLIFKARVQVKPQLKLGEYKGVTVEHEELQATEEDVENHLKSLQERHARLESVEDRPIQEGDTAVIDFEGFIDGEAFSGGKGENYSLEIGSGSFIPGFEEQLIGMELGQEGEITVDFPEDYQQEDLAGKKAVFKVRINEIKKKVTLPLDDEFAKDVSEFETIEELREDVRAKIEESAKEESYNILKNKVLEKVLENCEVSLPEVMVERKIDQFMQDMEQGMQRQGITLEKYLEITQSSREKVREEYRARAEEAVKAELALEEIAKQENIEISEEDLDKEFESLAESYQQDKEKIKGMFQMQGTLDMLKKNLLMDKTLELLVEHSEVVEPSGDEQEKQEAEEESEGEAAAEEGEEAKE